MEPSAPALAGEFPPELDDAGKALRDRLIRLAAKKSSAYTALSLLKAYGSFKIGACLALNGDTYDSYASVGLGVSNLHIPKGGLAIPAEGNSFYMVPSPESLYLKFLTPGMNIWIFILTNSPGNPAAPLKDLAKHLLLVAEEPGSSFKPELIERILSGAREIFISSDQKSPLEIPAGFDLELPEEAAAEETPETAVEETSAAPVLPEEVETADTISEKVAGYIETNPVFQGILLEVPGKLSRNSKTSFAEQLMIMAGALGTVLTLPSKRALLLIPPKFDRELLAHRLSMSLFTEVLACFEANTQDKALELIQPYL
jgi:hypothetical protein